VRVVDDDAGVGGGDVLGDRQRLVLIAYVSVVTVRAEAQVPVDSPART
jgi:hypothetical protein